MRLPVINGFHECGLALAKDLQHVYRLNRKALSTVGYCRNNQSTKSVWYGSPSFLLNKEIKLCCVIVIQ